jgi:hypothetical protein
MGPLTVPVLTALAGVAVRAIIYAELLARLRWQERQQRASHRALAELARELLPQRPLRPNPFQPQGAPGQTRAPCRPRRPIPAGRSASIA